MTPVSVRPRSKYGAQPCEVDGIRFHSTAEGKRWSELRLLERAGEISELRRQVRFPLYVPVLASDGEVCGIAESGAYLCDFQYVECGATIVEDSKSPITQKDPVYRLKRKHMLLQYGIAIRET